MTKRKTNSPVVIDKAKFLLPKMEFFVVDKATGEGFFLCELGGKDVLEYNEFVEKLSAETEGKDFSDAQSIEIMTQLVFRSACDAKGNRLFAEEDVAFLSKKSPDILFRASLVAMRVSGIKAGGEVTSSLKNAVNSSSTAD